MPAKPARPSPTRRRIAPAYPPRRPSAPKLARARRNGMAELTGMRILITGASSGVGLAAVERFAREGAELVLIARGAKALEEAARRARRHGVAAHTLPLDVTDRAAAEDAVERAIELLGGLDAVVTNAGAVAFGHFLEVDPEDFDRTVEVTFTGAVNIIRAALPALRASCGTIVSVS